MKFEEMIKVLGSLVLSLIIVALPVLCGLSFGYNWYGGIKLFFIAITFVEVMALWFFIGSYSEEG